MPLDLKAGTNEVRFAEVTYQLEPDSVILRDPAGKHPLQILEQNYRNDPVSQGLLLSLYEDKTIGFLVKGQNGKEDKVVQGKVVRSGYVPAAQAGQSPTLSEPIVEVDGQLRFELPGMPLFPALSDKTILKPTLSWLIETAQPGKFEAELAYVTAGMTWEADYNIVAPETGDVMDLVGWITINNQAGKVFENAKIKLMAGDVNKVQPETPRPMMAKSLVMAGAMAPPVTEKAFEEYHLYTLARPTTLLDRQTKQVEFARGSGVKAPAIYVYDGAAEQYRGWPMQAILSNAEYGTQCNTKVSVMREFKNSEGNHLGMPLPKGRVRFYRQDDDGQLEFVGENTIDHTPKDELVRLYIGNAFDLVGERKRTNLQGEEKRRTLRETYQITLRNHKKQAVEIRAVEHLHEWANWEIVEKTQDFVKTDSRTVEFRMSVPPDGEKTISYTVKYTW